MAGDKCFMPKCKLEADLYIENIPTCSTHYDDAVEASKAKAAPKQPDKGDENMTKKKSKPAAKPKAVKADKPEESITARIAGENRDRMVACLKNAEAGLTITEAADAAQLTKMTAAIHLLKLACAGKLESAPSGQAVRYKLVK